MRALWTGTIGFGLVSIPVKLHSATKEGGPGFTLLHKEDHEPVGHLRVCRKDGKEVPYSEIVRGYELQKGDYVEVTDADLRRASPGRTKSIGIVSVVDPAEIDPMYVERPFFLEPGKGGEKAYTLLRNALRQSGKAGLARFVLRNRERLALVRPYGDALMLIQLRFHEELRSADELKLPDARVSAEETETALQLLESLEEPFRPRDFKDTYADELRRVIAEKAKGRRPRTEEATEETPTDVKDLLKLLRASLQKDRPKSFAKAKGKGRRGVRPAAAARGVQRLEEKKSA